MTEGEPVAKDWDEYASLAKELHSDPAADLDRTPRRREVEACFGQNLEGLLAELDRECGSRSAMLRRINGTLDANGVDTHVSRATLYNWLEEAGLK